MNFLVDIEAKTVENAAMKPTKLGVAGEFTAELLALKVLEKVPEGIQVHNNCPLFLVPMASQPENFRCIADMKQGQQNEACGANPIQMTHPSDDILPFLCNLYDNL